jgi:hypothetical protein
VGGSDEGGPDEGGPEEGSPEEGDVEGRRSKGTAEGGEENDDHNPQVSQAGESRRQNHSARIHTTRSPARRPESFRCGSQSTCGRPQGAVPQPRPADDY